MKNDHNQAVWYHPTKVAVIDDNYSFLQSFETQLSIKNILCRSFVRPDEFIQFFNEEYKKENYASKCLLWLDEEAFDHRTIDINIKEIYQEIYNPKRFDQISVVISDYAMPNMNGLDVFKNISDSSVKRILLTGEADEKLAVEAFNSGLIDAFVRKDDANFTEVIVNTIRKLQFEYFKDLSNLVLASLISDPNHMSCLNEKEYTKLFEDLFSANNICEYYLIDEFGSYLFLDIDGNPSWFILRSEEEMNAIYESAEEYLSENAENQNLLLSLKNKEKILFAFPNDDVDPTEWAKHLYPAQVLNGGKKYYYSFINAEKNTIDLGDFVSYKIYLS